MSLSLKLILYKGKKYADGTHPVMLQYIINRKTKRKVIYKCKPGDWDEVKCRLKNKAENSAFVNNFLSEQFAIAERDVFAVKSGTKKRAALFEKREEMTLEKAIDKDKARLKADNKNGSYNKLEGFKNQLREYTKIDELLISDMDLTWFQKYARYLSSIGNNGATAQKKIKTVRSIVSSYSTAPIDEDLEKFKVPSKTPKKQKLDLAEIKALESLELPEGELITATRDFFILQIYLRGIRVGDLLQAYSYQFDSGRFAYTMQKVDHDMDIKLIWKAQVIVDRYYGKYERLFPFFRWSPNPLLNDFDNKNARMKEKETCTSVINNYLKILARMAGIDKKLTSHIAKHSFAKIAIGVINNPMITMPLVGHSSLAIHQQYLEDIREEDVLDKAADDIFKD